MVEQTREVVVKWRQGDPILENGQPKTDKDGKVVRGEPVPVKTAVLKNLTSREAMAADDFALAISPTGEPSRDNRIRAFAVCSIRKIDQETILAPSTLQDFEALVDRFTPNEMFLLGRAHIAFSAELNEMSDPKDSASGPESSTSQSENS